MEIHILERGILSPEVLGHLIMCSQLLFDHPHFPHKPSPHQSPTFRPTFYKFIVIGPLGLDPVRHWARSKNRDPTVTIIGNIILYFSIFFDLWSASHSFFPRPTFLFIYFLFYEHSFLFLLQYYYYYFSIFLIYHVFKLQSSNLNDWMFCLIVSL